MSNLQCIQQCNQRTDERSIQSPDLVVGLDFATGTAVANRVAEQHSPQTETPTVLLQRLRQTKTCALLSIYAPTNASAFDPAVQRRQVTFLYAKADAQCRNVQQIENLADRETAVRQFEQVFDSNQ
ncbi:hypothetical protein D3C80_1269220 [compost metagenome]